MEKHCSYGRTQEVTGRRIDEALKPLDADIHPVHGIFHDGQADPINRIQLLSVSFICRTSL